MDSKGPTRREWLVSSAATLAATATGLRLAEAGAQARPGRFRIGMIEYGLRREATDRFAMGKQIGLAGVSVIMGNPDNCDLWLRRPDMQKKYLEAARRQGLHIPSICLNVVNRVPLMSEPRAALWTADAIEACKALGAPVLMVPFFGKGELKETNTDDMRRITEGLAELGPRAQKAGVILGLESTLSAEAHLKIIKGAQSKQVQVCYDPYNAALAGHDVLKEIRLLGSEHICEVHFKDYLVPHKEEVPLGDPRGLVDWPAVVEALKAIRYDGWILLETRLLDTPAIDNMKKNLAYVQQLVRAK